MSRDNAVRCDGCKRRVLCSNDHGLPEGWIRFSVTGYDKHGFARDTTEGDLCNKCAVDADVVVAVLKAAS